MPWVTAILLVLAGAMRTDAVRTADRGGTGRSPARDLPAAADRDVHSDADDDRDDGAPQPARADGGGADGDPADDGAVNPDADAAADDAPPANDAPPAVPKPPVDSKTAAVNVVKAISDLRGEYAAHLKDPSTAKLRTQCSYFLDHPNGVSTEAILVALERSHGPDPRLNAYVKWQLLSGAPEKFEADFVPRAAEAYRRAPEPAMRLGMSQKDQARLDAALRGARPEDDLVLTDQLEAAVRRAAAADAPVLAYRDELYARLPPCRATFVAALEDGYERLNLGVLRVDPAKPDHMKKVVDDMTAWAVAGGGKPADYAELAAIVGKLRQTRAPPYYVSARVRRDRFAGRDRAPGRDRPTGGERLMWSTRQDSLYAPSKLEALQRLLLQAARGQDLGAAR